MFHVERVFHSLDEACGSMGWSTISPCRATRLPESSSGCREGSGVLMQKPMGAISRTPGASATSPTTGAWSRR